MPGRLMFALAIAVVVLVGFTVVGLVAALLPVSEEVRAVVVAVGSVGFSALTLRYFNPDALDPEVLRRILNRLIALAEAAERQPPPAEQMEESDVARRGRMDRGGFSQETWQVFKTCHVWKGLRGKVKTRDHGSAYL